MKLHQYVDDILVRGSFFVNVREAAASARQELKKVEVAISSDKYQEASRK